MSNKFTIKLIEPIEAFGETLTEIHLRKPNAGDLEKCGDPVTFLLNSDVPEQERIVIDAGVITGLIARLADIPRGSARQMAPVDFKEAQGWILGFFGKEDRQTTSG